MSDVRYIFNSRHHRAICPAKSERGRSIFASYERLERLYLSHTVETELSLQKASLENGIFLGIGRRFSSVFTLEVLHLNSWRPDPDRTPRSGPVTGSLSQAASEGSAAGTTLCVFGTQHHRSDPERRSAGHFISGADPEDVVAGVVRAVPGAWILRGQIRPSGVLECQCPTRFKEQISSHSIATSASCQELTNAPQYARRKIAN